MAKGQPDFGSTAPTETIVAISDLGELAARLGSVDVFDRTGNVIFFDTFDGSLSKVSDTDLSAGGAIEVSNLHALHGDFSCKLLAPTSGYANIYYHLAYPTLSRMGFEFAWARVDTGQLDFIGLYIVLFDGTNQYVVDVYWDADTSTWYVYDITTAEYIALTPTVAYEQQRPTFHHAKLVVDFTTNKYVKLIADDLIYDLSAYPLESYPTDTPAYLQLMIGNKANATGSCTVHIDSVIVTQNEP